MCGVALFMIVVLGVFCRISGKILPKRRSLMAQNGVRAASAVRICATTRAGRWIRSCQVYRSIVQSASATAFCDPTSFEEADSLRGIVRKGRLMILRSLPAGS